MRIFPNTALAGQKTATGPAGPGMLDGVGHRRAGHWAAMAVGLAFIAGGFALGKGPYEDRQAFEKAAYCGTPAATRDDCITRLRMTVVSKSTYTTEDPDPNWPPPQPPPAPPPPLPPQGPFRLAPVLSYARAALPMSTTTHYKLTVRTEDGKSHTYKVDYGIYDAAKTGTTGVADVWHGRIARLRIGEHSDEQWSYWTLIIAWLLLWGGVMVIVGIALPLAYVPIGLVFGGWWAGNILFGLAQAWHPAAWVVPAVIAGGILLLRVHITVTDTRRYGGRRRF
jgi:hypothetical protein